MLWKESYILLLHDNRESHLDDDGEPVDIIKRGLKVANNMFNIHVFCRQRAVQDQMKISSNNRDNWTVNGRVEVPSNIKYYGTNIKTTTCMNNDNNFIIDYTNTGVANSSVNAANDKQLKVQNDKVEKTVPSERMDTNDADDKATVIAAIAIDTKLWNDKEEETVYCVTDSYDFYNINSYNYYLQWTFCKYDTHQFDLTFVSIESSTTLDPNPVLNPCSKSELRNKAYLFSKLWSKQ